MLNVVILNVSMLNAAMLNVVVLSDVQPSKHSPERIGGNWSKPEIRVMCIMALILTAISISANKCTSSKEINLPKTVITNFLQL
jgi:hypothetical protein